MEQVRFESDGLDLHRGHRDQDRHDVLVHDQVGLTGDLEDSIHPDLGAVYDRMRVDNAGVDPHLGEDDVVDRREREGPVTRLQLKWRSGDEAPDAGVEKDGLGAGEARELKNHSLSLKSFLRERQSSTENGPVSRAYELDALTAAAVATFGSETNVRILAFLAAEGPSVRARIAEALDVNIQTMQRHLAKLRRIGVIHARAIAPTGDWHRQEYVIDLERSETLIGALAASTGAAASSRGAR